MVFRRFTLLAGLSAALACGPPEMASPPPDLPDRFDKIVVEREEVKAEKKAADADTGGEGHAAGETDAETRARQAELLRALTQGGVTGGTVSGTSGGSSGGSGGATSGALPPENPRPAASGIDVWLAALPTEALVFNSPTEILYDDQVEVRLVIHPGVDGVALKEQFEATRNEEQTGEVQQGEARLSEEVGATLVCPRLAVTALTPERQLVSRLEPTEWRWAVRGSEEGAHNLTLSLYAILPERSSVRVLKTFERSMSVQVPPKMIAVGFVQDNWEWVWTVLLAPIGAWVLSRWRRQAPDQ